METQRARGLPPETTTLTDRGIHLLKVQGPLGVYWTQLDADGMRYLQELTHG